jgi:hypothetical protein
MANRRQPRNGTHITTGPLKNSQVAIGDGNVQTYEAIEARPEVTPAELAELRQMCVNLKMQVQALAPVEKKAEALKCVVKLEEAVMSEKPDLTTMGYVKNWFVKNLPSLAGAVTSLVVHPIVGKLVELAGEMLASELKERLGGAE